MMLFLLTPLPLGLWMTMTILTYPLSMSTKKTQTDLSPFAGPARPWSRPPAVPLTDLTYSLFRYMFAIMVLLLTRPSQT